MNKNWSLSTKIYGIVGVLIVTTLVLNVFSVFELRSLNQDTMKMAGTLVPRIIKSGHLMEQSRLLAVEERNLALAETDAEKSTYIKKIDLVKGDIEKHIEALLPTLSTEGKEIFKKYQTGFDQYLKSVDQTKELVMDHKNEGSAKALKDNLLKGTTLRREAMTHLEEIVDLNETRMEEAKKDAEISYLRSSKLMILLSAFGLIGGMVLAYFVMKTLKINIDSIVSSLSSSSQMVAQSSEQISQAAEELSQATNEQASALQETSSATEEINSMVQKNTDNSRHAAQSAQKSLDCALSGKQTIEGMVGAIKRLEDSNQEIAAIVKVFTEIQDKTKIIDDIVFQTQLLSFNASVEAARAGEHGKGFAVVAEEVGNLAEMSGSASGEIGDLLSESLKKVEKTVTQLQSQIGTLVEEGGRGIKVLDQIVSEVQQTSQKTIEISQASEEQSRGIGEISKAMTQLDQGTQQNAATSQQTAGASEQLAEQAVSLQNTVAKLVCIVDGGTLDTENINSFRPKKEKSEPRVSKNVFPIKKSVSKSSGRFKKAAGAERDFEGQSGDDSDFVNL